MFKERPQAYLALPPADAASKGLANQIREVLESQGIDAFEPAQMSAGSSWSDQTQGAIREAEVVVADLTGMNPSVLFDVGIALGLRKPVLLLSQEPAKNLPLNLRAYQVAVYRPDDLATVRRYVELWLDDVRGRRGSLT
ncbi:MAG: nucleoside 2-deoxyribosyltransferase [Burkholderiales bacterium]|nr:nucleoside 2-deoxyribosyltransferase [Burkholderiales bacterium]